MLSAAVWRLVIRATGSAGGCAGASGWRLWPAIFFYAGHHEYHVFVLTASAPTVWQIEAKGGRLAVVGRLAAWNQALGARTGNGFVVHARIHVTHLSFVVGIFGHLGAKKSWRLGSIFNC